MPMTISIIPPTALILFPKIFPILLPNKKPANERENVTMPMTIMGVASAVWRNAKLKPTINASMLVATDNVNRV